MSFHCHFHLEDQQFTVLDFSYAEQQAQNTTGKPVSVLLHAGFWVSAELSKASFDLDGDTY